MTGIVVAGAAGRMGRQLMLAVGERQELSLAGATEHPDSDAIGADAGTLIGNQPSGVALVESINNVGAPFDTVIDFTSPANTEALLRYAADAGKSMVIGTTGLTETQQVLMQQASEQTALVYASNYSVGVTLTLELLARAAEALGDKYDIEIIESHHRHKVDAPSGTALSMGESIADALGLDLKTCAVMAREGITGARKEQTIGFSAVRAGDIIGEHTALFCGQGERLEITHKATDRMTFARGAARAASWVSAQPPGLYNMQDVLSSN
jgi:4-hydroxy-tetrahydrodipicolinate reductase